MKYTDQQRISKIINNAMQLDAYIKNNKIAKEDLLEKIELQWLVTTPLYNIGEHVYNLSDDFKNEHTNIAWNMIAGLRHRLIHDYEGTNWNIIANIVYEEIPQLIEQLEEITMNY